MSNDNLEDKPDASPLLGENEGNNNYGYFEEYHPPFLPVLIIAFPIMPFFWKYHVTVSKEKDAEISFGYNMRFSKKTVKKSDVISVSAVDYINGLTEFGGWGIKKNWNWETGYIAKNGPGIKITVATNKERTKTATYCFNCDDPQAVIDLIQAAG